LSHSGQHLFLPRGWYRKERRVYRVSYCADQGCCLYTKTSVSDTLFQGGCGRFFEGTAEEMHAALTYLSKLPQDTIVYNGHEYTSGSAKFGESVDPDNKDIKRLIELEKNSNGCTTGKSTIADELTWNVFMRLDSPAVQ
jgi:glyoxylase-like metal-dependent hydrolase (beta-lactamase superfamily II)